MKGKQVKNVILKGITLLAVVTLFYCSSGMQVWNGTAWVEPEPWQPLIPIGLSLGWLFAFGKANDLF